MKRHIFRFILLIVLIFGCDRDKKSDCTNLFCTDEFRSISVLIKHVSDNSAVVLTNYKVIRVSDNKDISHGNSINPENNGYYLLVDDTDRAMLRNSNVEIEFQGYIDNTLLIKRRFVVTADCCHISLVSGDTVIYI
ncbi:MAG TPA: hypothetical protein VF346_11475 [Bacteroidales bacterium]